MQLPSPSSIVCADWSSDPRRRAVYVADVEGRSVRRGAPTGPWTVDGALSLAATLAAPVLLGFDAPLGVPASYWELLRGYGPWTRCSSFAAWVRAAPALGTARSPRDWAVDRPFFAVPGGAGSLTRWKVALLARGVEMRRKAEAAAGAKSAFVVSGIPGSVGGAARDLWRGLADAHREDRRFSIWPFEPPGDGTTLAEIYPRAAYALALSREKAERRRPMALAKTKADVRLTALRQLQEARWFRAHRISLQDKDAALRSEDDFDALVTAAGLLRCVLEGTPLSDPALVDPVAEGAILGTGGFEPPTRERTLRTSRGPGRSLRFRRS